VNLLCIAGFLGSGKTTVLLGLARSMTESGLRLAIVENEIGDVGVDGGYVRQAGLPVQELFGGCICCTLQTGLVETLRALEQQYAPDWVIVEPTGLAAPGDLMKTVHTYMPQIARSRVLTLVDAGRWEMLQQVVEPLITAQLEAADVVAVNKVDQVDGAVLDEIEEAVRHMNASAPIRRMSASSGSGMGDLQGCLL